MKRTQVFLTEKQLELLLSESKDKQISKGELIRRIIDSYYEKRGE